MIWIQLIAIIGFLIYLFSFYNKDFKRILIFQIGSNVFYAIHYVLLGGYSGAILSLFSILRNLLVFKDKYKNLKFILLSLSYIVVGFFTYTKFCSILPVIGMIIYTFTLIYKPKFIKEGSMLSASFWLVYNIFVYSYAGIITETILLISNFILLLREKHAKR